MMSELKWECRMCFILNLYLNVFNSGEEREGRIDSKRGRIATNALSVPKEQIKG